MFIGQSNGIRGLSEVSSHHPLHRIPAHLIDAHSTLFQVQLDTLHVPMEIFEHFDRVHCLLIPGGNYGLAVAARNEIRHLCLLGVH